MRRLATDTKMASKFRDLGAWHSEWFHSHSFHSHKTRLILHLMHVVHVQFTLYVSLFELSRPGVMSHDFISDFLSAAEECIESIGESVEAGERDVDGLMNQAELLLRDITLVNGVLNFQGGEILLSLTVDIVLSLQRLLDERHRVHVRGRPPIIIPEEQLLFLLEHNFPIKVIASMLQVSSLTIRRRIMQYGMEEIASYSELGEAELGRHN